MCSDHRLHNVRVEDIHPSTRTLFVPRLVVYIFFQGTRTWRQPPPLA
jgi:hypothetical protein